MRVKFEMRSTKKSDAILAHLYVRVTEGRALNQAVKTRLTVNPTIWDNKLETIKSRAICKPEERTEILEETSSIRIFLMERYIEDSNKSSFKVTGWLRRSIVKYYNLKSTGKLNMKQSVKKELFDDLYDDFLHSRTLCDNRIRHYEVVRRMLHRYVEFVKCSQNRKRFVLDVNKVDAQSLTEIYDYIKNEYNYVEQYPSVLVQCPETKSVVPRGENTMVDLFKKIRAFFNWCYKNEKIHANPFDDFKMPTEEYGTPIYLTLKDLDAIMNTDLSDQPVLERQRDVFIFQCNVGCRVGDLSRLTKSDIINGAVEYIPSKTIKKHANTVVVPLNRVAQSIVDKYSDQPDEALLPFICQQHYNYAIKDILKAAGVTYLVTVLDPLTRRERKVPINEIASSHMARRTFIGNIYKLVKDQNLVASMTGHVEGSRAFNRYRAIDIDMKKDMVRILENGK